MVFQFQLVLHQALLLQVIEHAPLKDHLNLVLVVIRRSLEQIRDTAPTLQPNLLKTLTITFQVLTVHTSFENHPNSPVVKRGSLDQRRSGQRRKATIQPLQPNLLKTRMTLCLVHPNSPLVKRRSLDQRRPGQRKKAAVQPLQPNILKTRMTLCLVHPNSPLVKRRSLGKRRSLDQRRFCRRKKATIQPLQPNLLKTLMTLSLVHPNPPLVKKISLDQRMFCLMKKDAISVLRTLLSNYKFHHYALVPLNIFLTLLITNLFHLIIAPLLLVALLLVLAPMTMTPFLPHDVLNNYFYFTPVVFLLRIYSIVEVHTVFSLLNVNLLWKLRFYIH